MPKSKRLNPDELMKRIHENSKTWKPSAATMRALNSYYPENYAEVCAEFEKAGFGKAKE